VPSGPRPPNEQERRPDQRRTPRPPCATLRSVPLFPAQVGGDDQPRPVGGSGAASSDAACTPPPHGVAVAGSATEALRAQNAQQASETEHLTRRITELEQRLNQGSKNSSLPPSSPIHRVSRPRPPRPGLIAGPRPRRNGWNWAGRASSGTANRRCHTGANGSLIVNSGARPVGRRHRRNECSNASPTAEAPRCATYFSPRLPRRRPFTSVARQVTPNVGVSSRFVEWQSGRWGTK
jgi:hypothetical protein